MLVFDWDEGNLAHIARHQVSRAEAEEACSPDSVVIDEYDVDDEIRSEEVGQTSAGRILKVVTTDRHGKIRVVTAYDASAVEKKIFLMSRM